MTDFLQFLTNKTQLFKPILPLLEELISKQDQHRIIDLGSGGGGGLLWLGRRLKAMFPELQIILTDLYPNISAFEFTREKGGEELFAYRPESIDARRPPEDLTGIRTQFLSMHHFKPDEVVTILQNAVDQEQAIAIFEGQERSIKSIVPMLLSPISVLLTTPFIRPFKLGRILFTYLIPLVPIFVCWDGVVSALRTYTVEEMEAMVKTVKGHESFDWNIGKIASGPGVNLYLIGKLKNK